MLKLVVAGLAGLLQGVVEWLPVSSKTMITLVFIDGGGFSSRTAYVMGLLANFGSFFAALVFFRADILSAIRGLRHPFADEVDAARLRFLVLATFATALVGLPLYAVVVSTFKGTTGSAAMVLIGVLLLVTAAVNYRREQLARSRPPTVGTRVPGSGTSLLVGACQGLAALPGISRSAMTVTPLLVKGVSARDALRLSFFLDVVALLGAGAAPFLVGSAGLSAVRHVGVLAVVLMLAVAGIASFLMIGAVLRFAARLRASAVTLALGLVTLAAGAVLAAGVVRLPA